MAMEVAEPLRPTVWVAHPQHRSYSRAPCPAPSTDGPLYKRGALSCDTPRKTRGCGQGHPKVLQELGGRCVGHERGSGPAAMAGEWGTAGSSHRGKGHLCLYLLVCPMEKRMLNRGLTISDREDGEAMVPGPCAELRAAGPAELPWRSRRERPPCAR